MRAIRAQHAFTSAKEIVMRVTIASSLAMATLSCGAARMQMEVPVTLSELVDPETTISSAQESATIVVFYDGFPDPALQAVTLVTESGQFLGQLRPHSYTVAQVPPGRIGVYGGRPEMGYSEWCGGIRGEVSAGKVYVIRVGGVLGMVGVSAVDSEHATATALGMQLSYYSRYGGSTEAGQRAIEKKMTSYWQPCFKHALAKHDQAEQTAFGQIDSTQRAMHLQRGYGYRVITLPELD